jgi:hypothetical protein
MAAATSACAFGTAATTDASKKKVKHIQLKKIDNIASKAFLLNPKTKKELFAASALGADGELESKHIGPTQTAPTSDLAVGPELDFKYIGPNRFVVGRMEKLWAREGLIGKAQLESEVLRRISRCICDSTLNKCVNARIYHMCFDRGVHATFTMKTDIRLDLRI